MGLCLETQPPRVPALEHGWDRRASRPRWFCLRLPRQAPAETARVAAAVAAEAGRGRGRGRGGGGGSTDRLSRVRYRCRRPPGLARENQ